MGIEAPAGQRWSIGPRGCCNRGTPRFGDAEEKYDLSSCISDGGGEFCSCLHDIGLSGSRSPQGLAHYERSEQCCGVARAGGTQVQWTAPGPSSMKGHLLGFEVAVCGPYAIGSKSFSTALSIQCAGDPHVSVKRVAATASSLDMPCDASPTKFCIAVVNTLTTKGVSSSAVAGAGGLPPRAVAHLVEQATPSGTGIALGWAPGTQVKQPAGVPAETLRYTVLRNGHVIARAISGVSYVDNGCGAGMTCRESVEALTPGGAELTRGVDAPMAARRRREAAITGPGVPFTDGDEGDEVTRYERIPLPRRERGRHPLLETLRLQRCGYQQK